MPSESGVLSAARTNAAPDLRPALIAPFCLAVLVAAFFWTTPQRYDAMLALAAVSAIVAVAFLRHALGIARTGHQMAGALACLLGLSWAILPYRLYAAGNADQRMILAVGLVSVIANVCLIGGIWPLGLVYVLPLVLSAIYGIAPAGDMTSLSVTALILVEGLIAGLLLDRARHSASRSALERHIASERSFTIDHLLLDFEETASEWIWETDAQGRLHRVTERMAKATERGRDALEGRPLRTLLADAGVSAGHDGAIHVIEALKLREPFRNRIVPVMRPSGLAWWRLSAKPVLDDDGHFIGFKGLATDITEARTAEARIAYLANHDFCTGLPNRVRFHAHMQKECAAAATGGRGSALLSIDLDGFKGVNDRLGHAAGDEILKDVAHRLGAVTPPGGMAARLGGDEFAICCPTAIAGRASCVAQELIDAMRVPFVLADGVQVEISASVGIATTPAHGVDHEILLSRADLALYRAKAEGRNQWRIFIDQYERSVVAQRSLEADIRLALARREFELHYQPLVDVAVGRVAAFEALIRWSPPGRGSVPPSEFIPAAEAAGLVIGIDRWVLMQACRDAATWPDPIEVSVNVSPDHFKVAGLANDVRLALRLSGLDPRRLTIEVTEGVFLDRSGTAIETLNEIRRLGVTVALDDFGTGYSSLSYLVNFPIDKIKIDRSFVGDFIERRESRAIIDAIIALARKLDMRVVAEGVETSEQALALKLRRCDFIQGYLLGRARPLTMVPAMLAEVEARYREAVPTHIDSALGMALALRQQAV